MQLVVSNAEVWEGYPAILNLNGSKLPGRLPYIFRENKKALSERYKSMTKYLLEILEDHTDPDNPTPDDSGLTFKSLQDKRVCNEKWENFLKEENEVVGLITFSKRLFRDVGNAYVSGHDIEKTEFLWKETLERKKKEEEERKKAEQEAKKESQEDVVDAKPEDVAPVEDVDYPEEA